MRATPRAVPTPRARATPRRARGRTRADADERASTTETRDSSSSTLDALSATLGRDGGAKARPASTTSDGKGRASDAAEVDASGGRAAPMGRVKGIARFGAATGGTYDAPRAKPFAAYAIAATHAVVFVIDLVMYTSGHGNGGETFSRLALFDDAVVWGSQWGRVFTASLVDFGLVHFALVNVGLVTVGAEAEAILGGWNFTAVYALSAAVGGLGSMALDSTTLHVASSDGLFGVFGATLLYSAMNVENEWNNRGFTTRLFQCAVFAVGLQSLTAYPTENGAHVVNSVGHLWGFFAGAAMGYAGLAPLFTSGKKFSPPPSDGRKRLTDLHEGPRKTFVILGSVSTALALMSLVVILKRFFDVDPRDVF